VSSDECPSKKVFPSTPTRAPRELISRKGAKHVLSNVEGVAKEKNQRTTFFARLASWRDKFLF
jgi:hypothetical protein